MKILLIFGTRPEAIKMSPLIHELKSQEKKFEINICITAQHRQMLDQVLEGFSIEPDIDLNIMKDGQDLFDVTSNVLLEVKKVLIAYDPDIVLVHGDTTTTMASSVAAFYLGIPVGHVEAGLRTYDVHAPYPEEFNRQVVSKISQYHFAPTQTSMSNLLKENVHEDNIIVTGNTVIDALFWTLNKINSNNELKKSIELKLKDILKFDFLASDQKVILITGHRRENFGDGFIQICEALNYLASSRKEFQFVYPVHMNPNVQSPVKDLLGGNNNVHLIEPLEYEPFIYLLSNSFLVLTDSGGIQEEAPSLGIPVLVMRDITERPEAVDAGTIKLVGANKDMIIQGFEELVNNENIYNEMSRANNPYGDGNASKIITKFLESIDK